MSRLIFEGFSKVHIPYYYPWRNNPELAQYDQPGFVRPMSYEAVEAWCLTIIEGTSGHTFFIKDSEQDKYIGMCALMHLDYKNSNCELAIFIGESDYWSKGYGTEIMEQLLKWSFIDLNLHKVYLRVFGWNKRAIGLYEKVGFIQEGRSPEELFHDGHYVDVIKYGLFKRDYLKTHGRD